MELTGTVNFMGNVESGVSQAGNNWVKRTFAVDTDEAYPKKVAFTLFNDRVDELNGIVEGDKVKVMFDAASREHNGRWYTDLNAWKIDRL